MKKLFLSILFLVTNLVSNEPEQYLIKWQFDPLNNKKDDTIKATSRIFTGHYGDVVAIDISIDNRYLATGDEGGAIKLWDLKSGKVLKTFDGHDENIKSIAISPSNRYVVSGGDTLKIYINGKYSFDDLSKKVEESIENYIALPLIPTPELPDENSEFKYDSETDSEFKERLEMARLIQEERYIREVEARNRELEARKAELEQIRAKATEEEINQLFGKPLLANLTYNIKAQTAFCILYSDQSNFSQRIRFKIDPKSARSLFRDPNISNHSVTFVYNENGELHLKDIHIANSFSASLINPPHTLTTVAINSEMIDSLKQHPTPLEDRHIINREIRDNLALFTTIDKAVSSN